MAFALISTFDALGQAETLFDRQTKLVAKNTTTMQDDVSRQFFTALEPRGDLFFISRLRVRAELLSGRRSPA